MSVVKFVFLIDGNKEWLNITFDDKNLRTKSYNHNNYGIIKSDS